MYGKSTDLDITLLFRLLRTICGLVPASTGWDALPTSADYTLTADLARIKYYRNSVYGHVNQNMEIADDEFPRLWQEIGDALVRIAGQISPAKKQEWQEAIDDYLKDPLTAEDERNVQELLTWYRNDMEIKESMEELKSSTQDVQEGVGRVETSLKGVQRGIEGTTQVIEENVQVLETVVREEAKDIKDQLGEELKSSTRDVQEGVKRVETSLKAVQRGIEGTTQVIEEKVQCLETAVREETQFIKDQLGEVHQSIDRLSSSPGSRAQLRIRIDCEAIAEPGPRVGASAMLTEEGGPQAGDQEAVVTVLPIALDQLQAEAAGGFGVASSGNYDLPPAEGVLRLIALKYLQSINPSNPEQFNGYLQYLKEIRKLLIVDVQPGSLIITVECSSLEILEGLWDDYCTGHLNEMAQTFLVTEDILNESGLIEVKLTTTILEEEYRACREYFLQSPDIQERGELLMLPSRATYIAVVAIDFGTTFSGFAFAFNNKEGEKSIYMNKEWGTDQGYSTLKTPTCLLLNPNKSFNSFGYEAQDRFAELEEEEAQQYYYFEKFKMVLHNNENLNRETTLEASNGKHMKALEVFTYSIHYLYTRALEVIKERTGDKNFSHSDVQWVLTVPAIWKPAAKQFMREAAYQAGLASASNPEQILIALEPEAASVYCRERKMRDFVTESGSNDALVTDSLAGPNTQYVVVDIGGGTLDVTVHQLLETGAIREIYKATGGGSGGENVNGQFKALLESIFTQTFIVNYARQNPVDWLYLMNDFEVKKRGKRLCQGRTTRVRLPSSFIGKFSSSKGWDINTVIQQHYSLDEIKVLRNKYLCLEPRIMRQLFNPVLDDVIAHLSKLFAKPELSGVKYVFLVGGFADSAILQERIKSHFGHTYRILVPQYASLAVVQGAVMFGQKPDLFESRIMTATYGIRIHTLFLDGLHPESKKEVISGIPRCKDVFFKFVKANEVVKIGEKRRFADFAPLTGEQKQKKINFYQSERPDVEFVTDSGVEKAPGRGLVLETPEAWKTRDIEINLYFGGTEIKVTAVNSTSDRQSTAYLDFLATNQ